MLCIRRGCLKMNSVEWIKKSFALLINFHAVGRTGECASATWSTCYIDHDKGALSMDWSQAKVAKQKFMNFFPDRSEWLLDIYFAFAMYIIVGGGSEYAPVSSSSSSSSVTVDTVYLPTPRSLGQACQCSE